MADFYGTVADYKAYHQLRGNDVSEDTDQEIQIGLQVASEWIDATYGGQFGGLKVGQRDQIREWPRNSAMDNYGYAIASTSIPREVEQATYEAAFRQLDSGALAVDYTPNKYKRVSIDGAISVEYSNFTSAADIQKQYPIINSLLRGVLTATGAGFSSLSGPVSRI